MKKGTLVGGKSNVRIIQPAAGHPLQQNDPQASGINNSTWDETFGVLHGFVEEANGKLTVLPA